MRLVILIVAIALCACNEGGVQPITSVWTPLLCDNTEVLVLEHTLREDDNGVEVFYDVRRTITSQVALLDVPAERVLIRTFVEAPDPCRFRTDCSITDDTRLSPDGDYVLFRPHAIAGGVTRVECSATTLIEFLTGPDAGESSSDTQDLLVEPEVLLR